MTTSILSFAIVINELMAANAGSVMSPAINFDSWIELYNPTEQIIDLGGMYLSDDAGNLMRWQMPSDIGTIPAKGYKVIWLGSNDIKLGQNLTDVGKYQAPFKLDCDGGGIYLSDQNGNLITSEYYPEAMSRTSWARKTDGGDEWGWTADATPGASNATATFAATRLDAPVVDKDSQLFTSSLNVSVTIPEGTTLMYTTDGSLPKINQEYVNNGNCEGTDATCFGNKGSNNNNIVYTITDGEGVNSSRGIKVYAAKNSSSAQFFVYTPDHTWKSGEKYRFRMKVRADRSATIAAYAYKTPGNKITNYMNNNVTMLKGSNYNVTTEWTEISYEGTVSSSQSGSSTLQTIAFSLNNTNRTDINFYFDDISWESLLSYESEDGQFNLTATTNLTFRFFKDGFLPSVPVTRSYIKTSNNYTLPIISIVGDTKYFTDSKIGFDTDGDGTNGITGNGQNSPKNYNQDWDRPVNFSYLSPEGEMLFNQDVNIESSGGYTRTQSYRSFKLKANKVFDGQNRYDYMFFPQKPYIRSKTLLIRNGGNDIWRHNARFIDPALETIIQRSGIDVDVQSYVPVIEYVNGQLRGVFNLREPNNDDFAYANWGYDDEELDHFENLEMKKGDDVAINRIFELAKNINANGAYDELKMLLDIDEYTNYMAATLFLYNDDWPDNNIKAYRSRNNGRYRFVSYDLDYAFKGCWANAAQNPSYDNPFTNFERFKDDNGPKRNNHPIVYNKEFVNLFLDLLNHDGYRRKFIDTFCLMGGSVFEPTRANAIVDELLAKVKPMCDLMKQQNINSGHNPESSANTIKNNLVGRSQLMAGYMKEFSYLQLSDINAQNVTLDADTEGARLFINDINVPYADFDGHLFAPVTLRAEAPAGYSFAGWKQGETIVSNNIEMNLPTDETVSLTATFTRLEDNNLPPVRINEVSAANGIYVNEYFKRNDWIELYNTTSIPIDVQGMYLSDNPDNPHKYQISAATNATLSTIIPAYGYLVVWCDKLSPLSQLHSSFKLAAEGGDVLLTASDDSWSDRLMYDEHKSDETVGRYPDGGDQVYIMNMPTIGKTNMISNYVTNVDQIIPGDVNGDGNVDIIDVTCITSYILGNTPNPFYEKAADLNNDNEINIIDVTAVTAIILSSN